MNLYDKWNKKLDVLINIKVHYRRNQKFNLVESVQQEIDLIKEFLKDMQECHIQ